MQSNVLTHSILGVPEGVLDSLELPEQSEVESEWTGGWHKR